MANMLLTDPPYNVDYVGKTSDAMKISNDNMEEGKFEEFLVRVFQNADSVMKKGAAFYIWHADSSGYAFRRACHDIGWQVRECLIWNKNTFVLGRQDYHWKHEPCLYGWKAGAGHYFIDDRTQSTVLDFDRPQHSSEHPTMKPVEMFAKLIANSSLPGDIILDLFGGSGTTLMACEQLSRKACLMELDPHYCDVILARWEKFTNQKAKKIN